MNSGRPAPLPWDLLEPAGDEAILPAGILIADERRPGRQCFVLIEGTATVEAGGQRLAGLEAGAFVGSADPAGRPGPPAGVTVRLESRSRVLVLDAQRLATLIDADPAAAAQWDHLTHQHRA
jgi:hypothetical protein